MARPIHDEADARAFVAVVREPRARPPGRRPRRRALRRKVIED